MRLSSAQLIFENSWKVGRHNASSGTYLRTALSGTYQKKTFSANSQVQFNIINTRKRIFSGLLLKGNIDSVFQKFPITVSAQYLFLPLSKTLRETDWTITATGNKKHFTYSFGFNFRTYTYTRKATKDYNIEERRFHENWGLIYTLGYTYVPQKYLWNIGLFFTNQDVFLLNQDVNPYLRLKTCYHLKENITLYLDANYIKSGVFNGSSNYFGYYLKTGIIWVVN